ncbi:protein kinase [Pyxidicoccus sp. QH1ED-7-1]|nr:protein kinase [Pyxidicoccus xibeiensis]
MGEVFLAKISGAAGFEKPCIVKTILPTLLKDRQFLDRFHHEAKVLVHLVHSSIAQVYDMGEMDGTYYMALEYVAGVDLAYLLEQARAQGVAVPAPVALFIGQRMAEGLGYAHRKAGPDGTPLGIVHRDVSPHNVMVSYEGEVKVIDFGLAKSAARSKYTLPATVMGKLGYMSPEQVRAEALDHRSDIYSCGVVVWEMLAGRSLIPHGTVGEMMAAMSQPVVPPLHELRKDVDATLDAVVRRALEAKPDARYGRSDEFARALNGELVRSGAEVGAEEVGHFVRGLCPEAFAAQRKLISKVSSSSSHRRTPAPVSGTGTGTYGTGPQPAPEDDADMTGHEPTVMRNVNDLQPSKRRSGGVARPDAVYAEGDEEADTGSTTLRQAPRPAREGDEVADVGPTSVRQPSGSTPAARAGSGGHGSRRASRPVPAVESEEGTVEAPPRASSRPLPAVDDEDRHPARRRPMGLYAAIAVLLVIATAATTALFVGRSTAGAGGQATVAPATGTAVKDPAAAAAGTPAPGTAPAGAVAGSANPGSPGTPPAPGTAPVVAAVGQGAPGAQAVPSSAAVGTGASGTPGTEGVAAQDPAGGKRPVATAKLPGRKKPVTAPEPEPTSTVKYVSPASVHKVLEDGGRYYIERGLSAGLIQGAEVQVVGPAAKNGQRPVLGLARVVKPPRAAKLTHATRIYLELDEDALEAGGVRFIPVAAAGKAAPAPAPAPEEETAEAAPAEEPVKPAETGKLNAGVRKRRSVSGLFASTKGVPVTITNKDSTAWTNCDVVTSRRMVGRLGHLAPGASRTIEDYKPGARYSVGSDMMGIYCDQGKHEQPLR